MLFGRGQRVEVSVPGEEGYSGILLEWSMTGAMVWRDDPAPGFEEAATVAGKQFRRARRLAGQPVRRARGDVPGTSSTHPLSARRVTVSRTNVASLADLPTPAEARALVACGLCATDVPARWIRADDSVFRGGLRQWHAGFRRVPLLRILEALRDRPCDALALIAAARILVQLRRPLEAATLAVRATTLSPANADAHRCAAAAHLLRSAVSDAVLHLRAAARLEPWDDDTWRALAHAEKRLRMPQGAAVSTTTPLPLARPHAPPSAAATAAHTLLRHAMRARARWGPPLAFLPGSTKDVASTRIYLSTHSGSLLWGGSRPALTQDRYGQTAAERASRRKSQFAAGTGPRAAAALRANRPDGVVGGGVRSMRRGNSNGGGGGGDSLYSTFPPPRFGAPLDPPEQGPELPKHALTMVDEDSRCVAATADLHSRLRNPQQNSFSFHAPSLFLLPLPAPTKLPHPTPHAQTLLRLVKGVEIRQALQELERWRKRRPIYLPSSPQPHISAISPRLRAHLPSPAPLRSSTTSSSASSVFRLTRVAVAAAEQGFPRPTTVDPYALSTQLLRDSTSSIYGSTKHLFQAPPKLKSKTHMVVDLTADAVGIVDDASSPPKKVPDDSLQISGMRKIPSWASSASFHSRRRQSSSSSSSSSLASEEEVQVVQTDQGGLTSLFSPDAPQNAANTGVGAHLEKVALSGLLADWEAEEKRREAEENNTAMLQKDSSSEDDAAKEALDELSRRPKVLGQKIRRAAVVFGAVFRDEILDDDEDEAEEDEDAKFADDEERRVGDLAELEAVRAETQTDDLGLIEEDEEEVETEEEMDELDGTLKKDSRVGSSKRKTRKLGKKKSSRRMLQSRERETLSRKSSSRKMLLSREGSSSKMGLQRKRSSRRDMTIDDDDQDAHRALAAVVGTPTATSTPTPRTPRTPFAKGTVQRHPPQQKPNPGLERDESEEDLEDALLEEEGDAIRSAIVVASHVHRVAERARARTRERREAELVARREQALDQVSTIRTALRSLRNAADAPEAATMHAVAALRAAAAQRAALGQQQPPTSHKILEWKSKDDGVESEEVKADKKRKRRRSSLPTDLGAERAARVLASAAESTTDSGIVSHVAPVLLRRIDTEDLRDIASFAPAVHARLTSSTVQPIMESKEEVEEKEEEEETETKSPPKTNSPPEPPAPKTPRPPVAPQPRLLATEPAKGRKVRMEVEDDEEGMTGGVGIGAQAALGVDAMGQEENAAGWHNRVAVLCAPAPPRHETLAEAGSNDALRSALAFYYSGEFMRCVRVACELGRRAIFSMRANPTSDVVVFDVDDTALSSFHSLEKIGFRAHPLLYPQWLAAASAPALAPVRDLFLAAQSRGFRLVFISERPKCVEEATKEALARAGYRGTHHIILRPEPMGEWQPNPKYVPLRSSEFKCEARTALEAKGYRIVMTVGDQLSDFDGGHTGIQVKIPNMLYTTD